MGISSLNSSIKKLFLIFYKSRIKITAQSIFPDYGLCALIFFKKFDTKR
jgi:hypothetical protein